MTAVSTHQSVRIAEWQLAVYCHPQRPPAKQRDVLTSLAVRFLDWKTGMGYASIQALADFCEIGRATVQRALQWGRKVSLLVCTRRGHRLGDGTVIASEWKLLMPSQDISTPAVENDLYASGVMS